MQQAIDAISQFSVGALTIAASREAAVRAEILKVGDPVRVLTKPSYGDPKVHTGVIVGFEPFKEQPTVIIAYIEDGFASSELKTVAYSEKTKDIEILAAMPGVSFSVERSKVLDYFDQEQRKLEAKQDELKAKRVYFERYFGHLMKEVPQLEEAEA